MDAMPIAGASEAAPAGTVGAVPRALRHASWGVLAACVVMTFAGGWRIGATTDEPYHVQRFNNYLQTGWYLIDGQVSHGQPVAGTTQQYVYGPVSMLVLHAVNAVVGVEPWGHAGDSAHAYAVRHLTVGAFAMSGLLAVIVTGRLLLRRWDWGLVAGAMMVAVPLWTGHAMFNVKDVPVGAGYAWATLGLVLLAEEQEPARRLARYGAPSLVAAGTVLAVGTRPAMWSGIAFGVVVLVVCRGSRRHPMRFADRMRADLWVLRDLAIAILGAWIVLWRVDPKVFGAPVTPWIESIHSSADFQDRSSQWQSIPVWVVMQIPLAVVCFFLLGCCIVFARCVRTRFRLDETSARHMVVGAQALSMPIGVMVTESPVYGDLRHVLFSVPATALVATIAVAELCTRGRGAGPGRRRLTAVVAAVGLVVPLVAQSMLFPYNYVFYNPLATASGLKTNGDYLRGSGLELAEHIPAAGRVVCSPEEYRAVRGAAASVWTRWDHLNGWTSCRTADASPISPYVDRFSSSSARLAPDAFWVVSFNREGYVASNCKRVVGVSRAAIWQHVQLATLSRCTLPFPTMRVGVTRFQRGIGQDDLLPDEGWLVPGFDQTTVGLRAAGARATMTFQFAPELSGHAARLTIRSAATTDAVIGLGGTSVTTRSNPNGAGWVVTVPPSLVDRAVRAPVTLSFDARPPGDLNLKILSITLSEGAASND